MNWYKGNLHMHSFWSDGHGFPEMIAAWFKERGYHFIAFTEHDRHQVGEKWVSDDPETPEGKSIRAFDLISRYIARYGDDWVERQQSAVQTEVRLRRLEEYRGLLESPGRFAIFGGEEVTAPFDAGELHQTNWINVYNLPQALGRQRLMPDSVAAIQRVCHAAAGGVASLNHPNWRYNATADAIVRAPELRLMEIHTALNTCNNDGDAEHPSVEAIWDRVLCHRAESGDSPIYGLVTDDCHAYDADHHLLGNWALPGRAWVMVRAGELSQSEIFNAILRGDFYGSTGVALRRVDAAAGRLAIDIATEPGVSYTTRFIGGTPGKPGIVLHETQSTCPEYRFNGDLLYVRAVVHSNRPHPNPHRPGEVEKAWVQPVFVHPTIVLRPSSIVGSRLG
jgi:hypothetical protein